MKQTFETAKSAKGKHKTTLSPTAVIPLSQNDQQCLSSGLFHIAVALCEDQNQSATLLQLIKWTEKQELLV